MLDSVVANFLDGLDERGFDAPFMALLRARGFRDVHFLHGPFEYGKDFIAKHDASGVTIQYVFQSKAGNLAMGDWNAIKGQLDSLRNNELAHPSFDKRLPRHAI